MTLGVALVVLSSLTRTQSRVSGVMAPGGSHGTVETNARRLSFQIASVGRPSTALSIVHAPGCGGGGGPPTPTTLGDWGAGRPPTPVRIHDRLAGAEIEVTPPPACVPVIRA